MIDLWSPRWMRLGCCAFLALVVVGAATGWVLWMRYSVAGAVVAGDLAGVKLRVALGASLTQRTGGYDQATPLYRAVQADQPEMIEYLVTHGADPDEDGRDGETPFHAAIGLQSDPGTFRTSSETVALLVRLGADLSARDQSGDTPLLQAVMADRADVVGVLVDAGADVARPDTHGSSPLLRAVWAGHRAVAEALLDHGADIEYDVASIKPSQVDANGVTSSYAMTPLAAAVDTDDVGMVRLLLEHGADPDHAPQDYYRPITRAAMEGQTEVARLLLERGARPDRAGEACPGPLYFAVAANDVPMVKLLLEAGADPNATDSNIQNGRSLRETPLDLATSPQCIQLLEEHGATKRITTAGPLERLGNALGTLFGRAP